MKAPIEFVYGNCVFATGLDDGWAAFAVDVSAYQWLSEEGKRARFLTLVGALEAIEADVQILRVGRRWEVGRYAIELNDELETTMSEADSRCRGAQLRADAKGRYVGEHVRRLTDLEASRPAVFLLVSLRDPERTWRRTCPRRPDSIRETGGWG